MMQGGAGAGVGAGAGAGAGGQSRILSLRGSVSADKRTNTLFIQDTPKRLEEIQQILNKVDVAVRQVMIESRLVLADDKFSKSLRRKVWRRVIYNTRQKYLSRLAVIWLTQVL